MHEIFDLQKQWWSIFSSFGVFWRQSWDDICYKLLGYFFYFLYSTHLISSTRKKEEKKKGKKKVPHTNHEQLNCFRTNFGLTRKRWQEKLDHFYVSYSVCNGPPDQTRSLILVAYIHITVFVVVHCRSLFGQRMAIQIILFSWGDEEELKMSI